jgi:tRNA (guanine-N7-)-methyltransferase
MPREPGRRTKRKTRLRQHVNPLALVHQYDLALPPNWAARSFGDPTLPVWIDVGSGTGSFVVDAAVAHPDRNMLGLEIRAPAVERSQLLLADLPLPNAHFETCNANVHLPAYVAALQGLGPIERVCVQMPDPWFKKRHRPRRVMTPQFVALVAAALAPGGTVFIQSDVLAVASDMRLELDCCEALVDVTSTRGAPVVLDEGGRPWLADNPLGVPTRREQHVESQGLPVYRALYAKR